MFIIKIRFELPCANAIVFLSPLLYFYHWRRLCVKAFSNLVCISDASLFFFSSWFEDIQLMFVYITVTPETQWECKYFRCKVIYFHAMWEKWKNVFMNTSFLFFRDKRNKIVKNKCKAVLKGRVLFTLPS